MNTRPITSVALAALAGLIASPVLAQDTVAEACGKQWTVADTNDDLALTPEEAEASRDMDFSRLDHDGDGEISQDEWAACNDMSIVGQAISGSDEGSAGAAEGGATESGFLVPDSATGDADQSGGLSREEMTESMKQTFAEASPNAEDQSRNGVSEETQARFSGAWFALHDQNSDGEISAEEVAEVDLDRASSEAFDRIDANDDGLISRDEYDELMITRFEAAQERASGGLPVTVWNYYVVME